MVLIVLVALAPASRGDDDADRARRVKVALALCPGGDCDKAKPAARALPVRLDWLVEAPADNKVEVAPMPKVAAPKATAPAPAPARKAPVPCDAQANPPAQPAKVIMPPVGVSRDETSVQVYLVADPTQRYILKPDASEALVKECMKRLAPDVYGKPTEMPGGPVKDPPPKAMAPAPSIDWLVWSPTYQIFTPGVKSQLQTCDGNA